MRAPRRADSFAVLAAVLVIGSLAWAVSARGRDHDPPPRPASWRGLIAGPRPAISIGERMIVLLRTPSLAQRLAKIRYATEARERAWTLQADAAQKQVETILATMGVAIYPDYSYYRVVDGFSAELDPRAVALLEQNPEVAGIYPVRAAFPASSSRAVPRSDGFVPSDSGRPEPGVPGFDGRGVTIALLDTGVDAAQPYVRGRVLPGIDILDAAGKAAAGHDPQDPRQVEQHGTELAGILVGAGGPAGLHGVAPGANVLPIRIAGWQPDASGHDVVYARSDQLIAGLDRAVDPNGDGDAHDAARVALVGVAEPYAAFVDGPEAQAVQGALDLNTVVVAPAGNDGAAGPSFGSIAGPAGAPDAVAVAATDGRLELPSARVVLRLGLNVIFDRRVPLIGPVVPRHSLTLGVAAPARFFDSRGNSLVAGRAAVLRVGRHPQATAAKAAQGGAAAVVFYGASLPPGSLPVEEGTGVPVVAVPAAVALELLAAQRAGVDVGIAIGVRHDGRNGEAGFVAGFSSRGLAFDGSVKPDLGAPGIGIATAEPGLAPDGSPLYGTVTGSSAAAANVAGSAAVLTQMRPALAGSALRSLLVGYAQAGGAAAIETGAGSLRIGASVVGEVAADQATLGFGTWQGPRWHGTRTLMVRNVSTRRLQLSISAVSTGESEALHFRVVPDRLVLRVGRAAPVTVTVSAPTALRAPLVTGAIQVAPAGGVTLRVPWAVGFGHASGSLLPRVTLSERSFTPSDASPAILTIQAGNVVESGGVQIEPVARMSVLLYDASGRYIGVMARLRDLLPGSYSFGITGRGPSSLPLKPGRYELRLAAWPTLPAGAKPSRARIRFQIE